MSIDLKIDFDPGTALTAPAKIEAGLNKASDATDRTAAALGKMATAGGAAGEAVAAGSDKAADALDRTAVAARGGKTALDDLNAALAKPNLAGAAAAEAMAGDQAEFERMIKEGTLALAHQTEVLDRIKAPMKQYQADLVALNALLDQGKISQTDYNREMERAQQRAQSGVGPMQGPKQQPAAIPDDLKREADLLERIQGPAKQYQNDLAALEGLLAKNKIGTAEYDTELDKLNKRFGTMQGPISRVGEQEAATLQRLRGPMQAYETEVQTLERLMKRGAITADEYQSEFEKQAKKAGVWQGPIQQKPTDEAAHPASHDEHGQLLQYTEAIAPKFGAAGEALAGFASKGAIAAGATVGLAMELAHLGDEYITLSNAAQKVTEKGGDVNETLRTQLALSVQLHSSIEQTLELYDAVRDGTDELNFTQRQQLQLTKEIGDAVLAEGKQLGAAEGLMKRLTYAFASGTIQSRDLKGIMKDFPDIGAAFVETLGHSRKELVDMASKGMISADMLIDAFDKMGKGMAEKVDKKIETTGQKWQHFKDELTLGAGTTKIAEGLGSVLDGYRGLGEAIGDGVLALGKWNLESENSADALDDNADKIVAARMRIAQSYLSEIEALKQLSAAEERNAKTAEIASTAKKIGVAFPEFDEALANKAAEARIKQREVGIEIGDAFDTAHARATLFGNKLTEIQDRKEAEKIAEDVKRIYSELHGVDDLMDKQFKRWTDLGVQIGTTTKAIERWKSLTPAGTPVAREQTELERQLRDLQTEQTADRYGKGVVGNVQGKAQAKDQLEDYTRAVKEGALTQEAFRRKYDETMTTMNDGRLPEVIKLWEQFNDPIQQRARDIGALNALFRSGAFDAFRYNEQLTKIAKERGDEDARGRAWRESTKGRGASVVGPRRMGREDVSIGIDPGGQQFDRLAPVMGQDWAVNARAALDAYKGWGTAAGELNEQLERAHTLVTQFDEPLVRYEEKLKDIKVATETLGLTQEQATALQRAARSEYHAAMEALEKAKGPTEQYEATLRKLNHQLEDGGISAKQYGDGLDAAKIALIQATGAADEFEGAMQIEWIKLTQEADAFGASVAKLAVDDFGKLNDAIVTAANGGEVSWSSMADSMIQDLERVLLKWLEIKAITGIASLAAGLGSAEVGSSGGGGSSVSDVVTDLGYSARRGPGPHPAAVPAPGAYPYQAMTPGAAGSAGGSTQQIVQIHNHYDESVVHAAMDSPTGTKIIVNTLRANQGAIGAYRGR